MIPSDKMLSIIAEIEDSFNVKCQDYTFAGACNFIEKYKNNLPYERDYDERDYDLFSLYDEQF